MSVIVPDDVARYVVRRVEGEYLPTGVRLVKVRDLHQPIPDDV